MKILVIWSAILLTFQEALTPGYISGGMKRMIEMIVNWQREGIEVTVITTHYGEIFLKREAVDCKMVILKEPLFFQSIIGTKLGVSFVYLFRTFRSIFSPEIISQRGYDAVCATSHYLPDDFILRLLIILSAGKVYFVHLYHVFPLPSVGSQYQSITISLSNWVQQIIGFRLIQNCIILTFESQIKILQGYGFELAKIRTIGMGLNLEEIRSSPPLEQKFDAVFLGRLTRKKGIFDLLRAWKEVTRSVPKDMLCIAGQKSAEPVEESIDALGLQKNVTLYGVVSGSQKYGLLKSANIFIFPSYEEGWGVVISEALSCGLPAVVYDLPAYKLYGDAVIRVPVGNVDLLAREVAFLLSCKGKRDAMRNAALKVSSGLDWRDEAERELKLINEFVQVR